jgi:hypothetical protein
LTQKEQDVLLKILLSAKRPAQEILSALKIACQITNTSYEERMSVCIPDDERLGDFVGVLLKEGFIGFPRIAQKLIGLNNDLSSNVEEVLKTDLNLLQTSLASTVENPTNQKIIDLEALCLKVISFKVVLLEVNKYSKMEFSVIERVQEFLKDKVENARASLNKEAGECESTSYLNSSDQILRNYPQVKDLSRLILRNGTPVYCKGSGKPATLLRFRRYLKENPSV